MFVFVSGFGGPAGRSRQQSRQAKLIALTVITPAQAMCQRILAESISGTICLSPVLFHLIMSSPQSGRRQEWTLTKWCMVMSHAEVPSAPMAHILAANISQAEPHALIMAQASSGLTQAATVWLPVPHQGQALDIDLWKTCKIHLDLSLEDLYAVAWYKCLPRAVVSTKTLSLVVDKAGLQELSLSNFATKQRSIVGMSRRRSIHTALEDMNCKVDRCSRHRPLFLRLSAITFRLNLPARPFSRSVIGRRSIPR